MEIIEDYFTKALQGSQFRRFRHIIIGIHEYEILSYDASEKQFIEE